MCRSMVDIQSAAAEIRRGKKRKIEEEDRNYRAKILWSALLHRATITRHTDLQMHKRKFFFIKFRPTRCYITQSSGRFFMRHPIFLPLTLPIADRFYKRLFCRLMVMIACIRPFAGVFNLVGLGVHC